MALSYLNYYKTKEVGTWLTIDILQGGKPDLIRKFKNTVLFPIEEQVNEYKNLSMVLNNFG